MKINTDFVHPEDAPELQKTARKTFLKNLPLRVRAFDNAVIDPNRGVLPPFDAITPPPQINEAVVFIDTFGACWGHCITDHLRRLWFYFSKEHAALKNLKFIFIDSQWPRSVLTLDNFWAMLQTLGIAREKFHLLCKPTRFACVFVPDPCFFYDVHLNHLYYTKEFLDFFNKLPQLKPPPNLNIEKIYLSRTAFKNRRDCNEKDVENCFKNQGFTIIYPEKLDFLTELSILQNCKVFATTDGSIAHNFLFCQPKTTSIICRKTRHATEYQMAIHSFKNANVFYIDVGFSPFLYARHGKDDWWGGPFFLYETKYLRRFFNLPLKKTFPFLKFFKYFLFFIDTKFLVWTHHLRGKLKIGTKIRQLLNKIKGLPWIFSKYFP